MEPIEKGHSNTVETELARRVSDGDTLITEIPPTTGPMQSPPTVIEDPERLRELRLKVEEVLGKAGKKLADEEYSEAIETLNVFLEAEPDIGSVQEMRRRVEKAASTRVHEIFNQGLTSFTEGDWDRAIETWKKGLKTIPEDPTTLEWIRRAEEKRDLEKKLRTSLLVDLEECGRHLSERNYVVAEEHLDTLKGRFTTGFRLFDLQRIYEALVVRTRVELEKEFEELRSNMIEPVPEKPVARPAPAINTPVAGPQTPESVQLQKQYLEAFQAGKRFYESAYWQKALDVWQAARRIHPQDENLIHWMALAESHLIANTGVVRSYGPVRAVFAFLSVFVVTGALVYFGYQKYAGYVRESRNSELAQRAIEHYRGGRLEESWKILQLLLLQDPGNESTRLLLDKVMLEMRGRKSAEERKREAEFLLDRARKLADSGDLQSSLHSYLEVLKLEPANAQALKESDEIKDGLAVVEAQKKMDMSLEEVAALVDQGSLVQASQRLGQILETDPDNGKARLLQDKISRLAVEKSRIAGQLELAAYLQERGQTESSAIVLNKILSSDPSNQQARRMLANLRSAPQLPKVQYEIRVEPPARLFLDGRDMGENRYFSRMDSLGTHILHFERSGYRTLDQSIELKQSGNNSFSFEMQPVEK